MRNRRSSIKWKTLQSTSSPCTAGEHSTMHKIPTVRGERGKSHTLNFLRPEKTLNSTCWNCRKGWLSASVAVSLFPGSVTRSLLIWGERQDIIINELLVDTEFLHSRHTSTRLYPMIITYHTADIVEFKGKTVTL